jgi:uncharacterized membrane protein
MTEHVEPAPAPADLVREEDKALLLLTYLPVLAVLPFYAAGDREYLRWHARQGLALSACYGGWLVLSAMLVSAGGWIGGPTMAAVLTTLGLLGMLGLLGVSVLGILKAFEPSRWRIPVVSSLAEKL